jgi:hypothetical protein
LDIKEQLNTKIDHPHDFLTTPSCIDPKYPSENNLSKNLKEVSTTHDLNIQNVFIFNEFEKLD